MAGLLQVLFSFNQEEQRVSRLHTVTSALALSLLALSPPSHAQDTAMTPQEIQATWAGKTVSAKIGAGPSVGKVVELELKADGSAQLGGALLDNGAWRLSDKGYCATWKKIRAGQEGCFTVVRKGSRLQVFNPDSSLNSIVTAIK